MVNVLSLAGPGLKHDIQRALNVRNLGPKTAITKEQADYIDHKGSYLPKPRLRDMDVQGIDQVMIIPTEIDTYPWMLNAVGAKAMCKAYNEWAYEYCQENPERLFFAACCRCRIPSSPNRKLYRVADKGCRVAWSGRSMRWATIRSSPSTSACGGRWRRPAWFTGCIRFPHSARSSRPDTPSNTRAPS